MTPYVGLHPGQWVIRGNQPLDAARAHLISRVCEVDVVTDRLRFQAVATLAAGATVAETVCGQALAGEDLPLPERYGVPRCMACEGRRVETVAVTEPLL